MRTWLIVILICGLFLPITTVIGEEAVDEVKYSAPPPAPAKEKEKGVFTVRTFAELFEADLSLTVSLDEVIILVVLVNVFALFRKPRLILATSYLFALKWVFWSNYTAMLKQSSMLTQASGVVFAICGVLTVILFCLDKFTPGE